MGLMTPNKTQPQNGGDATGFQDLGGGVRENENVRERREESPQVLGSKRRFGGNGGIRRKRQWWCNGVW